MRTEAALSGCGRSRQPAAFGATIEKDFAQAVLQNTIRRSFHKRFVPCGCEMPHLRVIGE